MVETSVIIPTYNRLPFLKEAIASVLGQSHAAFELLVVDDGSTDGTREFVAKTPGIKYLFQQRSGPAAARNTGINNAHGEFITFLDSDDIWHPDKLASQVEMMRQRPQEVVCYTDENWIRKGVKVNPRKKHAKHSGWIFEQCLPLCIVSPSSVLMRRRFFEIAGLFDPDLPACEDYDLWLRASLHFPFYYIPKKLITKRGGHPDQLSAQWGLDVYRVRSLTKLLDNPRLPEDKLTLVLEQVRLRCKILAEGFRKRHKTRDSEYYAALATEMHVRLSRSG